MRALVFVTIASLAGCIEYTPTSTEDPQPAPHPRPLDTPTQLDRIVQVQQPEVDVLWVVDNSCSMEEEQDQLAANFPAFIECFVGSGLDWHIGVVSTDMDDASHSGRLRTIDGFRYIDADTPNPASVFSRMATMGISGSGEERGRDAAYSALEIRAADYNEGFVRPGAGLHVVAISDEVDYSRGISVAEFAGWMNGRSADGDEITFSSIVGMPDPPGSNHVCSGAWAIGTQYLQLTQAVGGIAWPICTTEWGAVLEQLGLQAAGLQREYFLSQLPVVDTIQVRVVDDEVTFVYERDVDWVYDPVRNSVTFLEVVPRPLAEVYIEYDLLAALEE